MADWSYTGKAGLTGAGFYKVQAAPRFAEGPAGGSLSRSTRSKEALIYSIEDKSVLL
jgi:hypothetical protein